MLDENRMPTVAFRTQAPGHILRLDLFTHQLGTSGICDMD